MANCENCAEKCVEIEKKDTPDAVPYIVYESAQARNERNVKRLVIALIVAVALIFASNAAWLWVWNQYEFASYEVSTDGGGDAYYSEQHGDGDINYGKNPSEENNEKEGENAR